MGKGTVIFLNGTSSAGKTSLATKIQEILEEKSYHVQLDTFCDMIHDKFYDENFVNTENKAVSIMNKFILSLCESGENVIVDTVIENHHEDWLRESVELLHDKNVTFAKVNCPLHELERRELERGNREIGLAKFQFSNMDFNDIYDIEVNTYENSIDECAKAIINESNLHKEERAFKRIYLKNKNK